MLKCALVPLMTIRNRKRLKSMSGYVTTVSRLFTPRLLSQCADDLKSVSGQSTLRKTFPCQRWPYAPLFSPVYYLCHTIWGQQNLLQQKSSKDKSTVLRASRSTHINCWVPYCIKLISQRWQRAAGGLWVMVRCGEERGGFEGAFL